MRIKVDGKWHNTAYGDRLALVLDAPTREAIEKAAATAMSDTQVLVLQTLPRAQGEEVGHAAAQLAAQEVLAGCPGTEPDPPGLAHWCEIDSEGQVCSQSLQQDTRRRVRRCGLDDGPALPRSPVPAYHVEDRSQDGALAALAGHLHNLRDQGRMSSTGLKEALTALRQCQQAGRIGYDEHRRLAGEVAGWADAMAAYTTMDKETVATALRCGMAVPLHLSSWSELLGLISKEQAGG